MVMNATKMEMMLIRISLGEGIEKLKARGLIEDEEDEKMARQTQKDVKDIRKRGGEIGLFGDAGWCLEEEQDF